MPRDSVTLEKMLEDARDVRAGFAAQGRREWGVEAWVAELAKQVGDLAAQILTRERYYLGDRDDSPVYGGRSVGVADELADILYAVFAIAEHYGIDLAAAHEDARRRERDHLRGLARDF